MARAFVWQLRLSLAFSFLPAREQSFRRVGMSRTERNDADNTWLVELIRVFHGSINRTTFYSMPFHIFLRRFLKMTIFSFFVWNRLLKNLDNYNVQIEIRDSKSTKFYSNLLTNSLLCYIPMLYSWINLQRTFIWLGLQLSNSGKLLWFTIYLTGLFELHNKTRKPNIHK